MIKAPTVSVRKAVTLLAAVLAVALSTQTVAVSAAATTTATDVSASVGIAIIYLNNEFRPHMIDAVMCAHVYAEYYVYIIRRAYTQRCICVTCVKLRVNIYDVRAPAVTACGS